MNSFRSISALSACIFRSLDTGRVQKVSGQLFSNPLPVTHLKLCSIFDVNARSHSTAAKETCDEKKSTAGSSNPNPFITDPSGPPTEKVLKLVDDVAGLTLNEVTDLTDLLRTKFDIKEMPIMTTMMPGMGMPVMPGGGGLNAGAAKAEETKAKTFFDLKLESFDAAAKIKIIKEVRTFTDLGLKEAKELVEKTPGLLKKGVTKEEGEQIIAKLKELGAKVIME
uniref:Uncharacterized protein n=1 Tax=Araucaria cunninghamii TaxID=56994 RepID=A0A0D6R675_ARACU